MPEASLAFKVIGDEVVDGSRALISRGADGRVEPLGHATPRHATIDRDGVLVQDGHRRVLDGSGRLSHVDDQLDVTIVGATTPGLTRRAMLVFVFVIFALELTAIDQVSH